MAFPGDVSVDLLSDDGDDGGDNAFFTPAPPRTAAPASATGSPTPRGKAAASQPAAHAAASGPRHRLSLGPADAGRGRPETQVSPAQGAQPQAGFGLKQTEKLIDDLKKENFSLKLKIYYLEEKLERNSPGTLHEAIKENAEHKTTIHQLTLDRDSLIADLDRADRAVRDAEDARDAALASRNADRAERETAEAEARALRAEMERYSRAAERAEEAENREGLALRAVEDLERALDEAVQRVEEEVRRADEEARRADDAAARAEDEARRAEEEANRAEEEARRADEEARRAEDAERAAREADRAAQDAQIAARAALSRVEEAEAAARRATEELRILRDSAGQMDGERERLLREIGEREREVRELRDRMADLESHPPADPDAAARLAELEDIVAQYRDEKERLRSHYEFRIQSLVAEVEEAESRAREAGAGSEQLRREADGLHGQLAAARAELAKAKADGDRDARELQAFRSQVDELTRQVVELAGMEMKDGEAAARLEAEVARLNAELERTRKEAAEEANALRLAAERAESEVGRMRVDVEKFRSAAEDSEAELHRAQGELDAAAASAARGSEVSERLDATEEAVRRSSERVRELEAELRAKESLLASLREQLARAKEAPPRQAATTPLNRAEVRTPPSDKPRTPGQRDVDLDAADTAELDKFADEHFERDVASLQNMINDLQERFGTDFDSDEEYNSRRSSFAAADPEQQTMLDLRNVLYGAVRVALKFAKELKEEKTVNRRMRMLYEKDDSLWRMEVEDREAVWKSKYEEVLAQSDARELAMQEDLQGLINQVGEMKATMMRSDADAASQAKRMLEEIQGYRQKLSAADNQLRLLEEENNSLKDQIDELDAAAANLKHELAENHQLSDESERKYQETLTAGERERKHLASKNQQLQDEIGALQTSLANLRQQHDSRIRQYQEDLEALGEQREQSRLEIVRLRAEADGLQQQLDDVAHRHTRESTSVSKENERLAAELGHATATVKELRATLASYEARLETLGSANDANVRELNQQTDRIAELSSTVEELRTVCETQKQDIRSWQDSSRHLESQLKNEKQRSKSTSATVEDLQSQVDSQHDLLNRVERRLGDILQMTGAGHALDQGGQPDIIGGLVDLENWVGSVQSGLMDAVQACRRKIQNLESNLQSQFTNIDDLENMAHRANGKQQQLSDLYNQTSFDLERTQSHMASFKDQLATLQSEIDSLLNARSSSSAQIRMLDQRVKAAEARAEAAERNLGGLQDTNAQARQLKHQLRDSEDRANQLEAQLQDVEERLRLERQGAKARVSELIENAKAQQRENEALEDRAEGLSRRVHELEREQQLLSAKLRSSTVEASEATNRQLQEAKEQLTEMRAQLESERETWRRLDGELNDLRAKYRRLKAQYERREQLVKGALESLVAIQEKKEMGALSIVTQHAAQAEKLLMEAAR